MTSPGTGQDLGVKDLSTTIVRKRKAATETQSTATIRISIVCNVMYRLRKNMTAIEADCHTFSCAKAASCSMFHYKLSVDMVPNDFFLLALFLSI